MMSINLIQNSRSPVSVRELVTLLWMLAMQYGLACLMVGQAFGDKYPFATVFPTGLWFGAGFCALLFLSNKKDVEHTPFPAWFAAFGMILGSAFFGCAVWLLPRMVGLGLIDIPKLSWGVQL
ncbi:MAG: hypothetical protein AAF494_02175 [Pseudomonadota bacterium]